MTTTPTVSKKPLKQVLFSGFILIVLIGLLFRLAFPDIPTPLAGSRPSNLGVNSGQLAPCPSSPNCVSSQAQDPAHYIEPLLYEDTGVDILKELERVIKAQPRSKIIAQTDNYLYAEFSSFLMGFVDDVEWVVTREQKRIDVRSASRLGESDLGVNRKRIEQIRQQLTQ